MKCLPRLVTQNGLYKKVHSHNGAESVDAPNEMRLGKGYLRSNQRVSFEDAVIEGFDWLLVPSCALHFRGLWEQIIKSANRHSLRVAEETQLTFYKISTVLAQVRACMDSRPLYPMSTNPTELNSLIPQHFLSRRPPTVFPDIILTSQTLKLIS